MSAENQESSDVFLPSAGVQTPAADTEGQNDSLAGLIGVGDDPPSDARPFSRLKSRTLGMLLVVLIAAGTLMIMRQLGLGTGLKMTDVKISYSLDNSREGNVRTQQKMLANLRNSSVTAQVPLKDVKKNPFLLKLLNKSAEASATKPSTPFDQAAYERQQRQKLIRSTFAGLKLNSVLGGAVSIARISDRNVRVGDTVADLFVVKSIHGRTVELSVDGDVYKLTVGK